MSSRDVSSAPESVDQNLKRLFVLRNFIIAGELGAIWIAETWMDAQLPLVPLGGMISAMVLLNVITWLRLQRRDQPSNWELFVQLVLDVSAFSGVLYLTGGATNPFAWLYLLPLVISATILPRRSTWAIAALSIASYSLLMVYYVPLPYAGMEHAHHSAPLDGGFSAHIFGMWFGFILSAGVIAHFVVSMAVSLRERDRYLAEVREHALRDERLIALGTLATGAAHELGTPLGTIAILAGELKHEYPPERDADLYDKACIISDQIKRCKETLSVISASSGEARAEAGHPVSASDYIHDLISEWRLQRPVVALEYQSTPDPHSRTLLADRTVTQALINILNNAADASPNRVEVDTRWGGRQLIVEIRDNGEGLDPKTAQIAGREPISTKDNGMGVGLFLAHATIRRMGGEISHVDREGGGTCTQVVLPLFDQEAIR
jgi:two-component system sensor histidine kinase RegB